MYDFEQEVSAINQSFMTWIIVFLLILIIVLLSVCIYLDVQLVIPDIPHQDTTTATSLESTTSVPTTSTAPSTSAHTTPKPPVTTQIPVTTTIPTTTTQAPVTTTVPDTTTQTPVTTQKPISPDAPTICIDPGHGFNDPGALDTSKKHYESDINLAIALQLKEALNAFGYNVVMTHDGVNLPDEEYLSPSSPIYNVNNRNDWITDRKGDIDLVVSIHCNSFPSDTTVKGSRYYILRYYDDGYNAKSITLANSLINAVYAAGYLSKKPTYYTQELAVLKTGIPSVLVECGFLSNATDLANMLSESWQKGYAKALAQGIHDYLS